MRVQSKKLIIDARSLNRGKGGIQRYLEKTLPFVIADNNLDVTLYLDEKPEQQLLDRYSNLVSISYPKKIKFLFKKYLWPIWALANLYLDKPDIYWSPRHHIPIWIHKECKVIVTIHDMVWKTVPETMPIPKRVSEMILMPIAIRRANMIITVSEATKNKIERFFPYLTTKIAVIGHGANLKKQETLPTETKNYFLSVGTIEPRKNYINLVKAFDEYVSRGGSKNLIIVGKLGWKYKKFQEQLKKSNHNDKITLLNNVDDNQLSSLYRGAKGLIMISLDEGYGLPPLEAEAYSIPKMLSNIDVFRELYPKTDIWVNHLNYKDIANKLFLLDNINNMKKNKKFENSALPSWETTANDLIKIIKQ